MGDHIWRFGSPRHMAAWRLRCARALGVTAAGLLLTAATGSLRVRAVKNNMKAESPARHSVVDADFHGRRAWAIENDRMRVSILRQGGHIGEVRLLTDNPRAGFNPMYIPPGAGYMGHMVCFPHFGSASPEGEEAIADLPNTNYRIERIVSLPMGETTVHVEETVDNLAACDRPLNRE